MHEVVKGHHTFLHKAIVERFRGFFGDMRLSESPLNDIHSYFEVH